MLSSDGQASDRQLRLSLERPGDETVPGAGGGDTPVDGTDLMERVMEAGNLRRALRQVRRNRGAPGHIFHFQVNAHSWGRGGVSRPCRCAAAGVYWDVRDDIMDDQRAVVRTDPEILGGTPVFAGTRVPVKTLFDYLEAGDTVDRFLDQFPSVSRAQAIAALAQARDTVLASARSA